MATVQTDDADGACLDSRCTPTLTFSSAHEVLMVLKETALCEHTVYKNGTERNLHRGANVHARDVICKGPECNRNVTKARTLLLMLFEPEVTDHHHVVPAQPSIASQDFPA